MILLLQTSNLYPVTCVSDQIWPVSQNWQNFSFVCPQISCSA